MIGLTKREKEIVGRIFKGETAKTIAKALYIELGTLKSHVGRARYKLGVPKGISLAAWELNRRRTAELGALVEKAATFRGEVEP